MSSPNPKASKRLKLLVFLLVCLVAIVVIVALSRRGPPEEEVVPLSARPPVDVEVGTRAVLLYFGSADGMTLVETTREIMASSEPATLLASVMRELLADPPETGVSTIPEETELRSAYVENGMAYLDFSRELRSGYVGGSTQEYILLASIVRTVSANFQDITRVQILIEGTSVESIGGHYEINEPLSVFDWQ